MKWTLWAALGLLVHHAYIHPEYDFPDRVFQLSDIQNHETWVLVLLALSV